MAAAKLQGAMDHIHLYPPVRGRGEQLFHQSARSRSASAGNIFEHRAASREVDRPSVIRIDQVVVPQFRALIEIRELQAIRL